MTEARALARRLAALDEGPMRTLAAQRALADATPIAAARLLGDAVALAGAGDPLLASALGRALLEGGGALGYEHLSAMHAAAVEEGLDEVRWLLVAPGPRRVAAAGSGRAPTAPGELTLGHKKTLARGARDPDLLARLAAEGDPVVVRELLRNPRVGEELVVRIAARRPCHPATLRSLHDDRRWRSRPAVARAICHNPYAEPALVAKLLPRLDASALAELRADAGLHALVRALAARLLAGRRGGGRPPRTG